MVAQPPPHDNDREAFAGEVLEDLYVLSEAEAWAFFDEMARRVLGIPGDEFHRRRDNGQNRPVPDTIEGRKLMPIVELLAYHWHPGPEYSGPAFPHLHVSAALDAQVDALSRRAIDLDKVHLPTGLVTLAAFVRMLITEFQVRPGVAPPE